MGKSLLINSALVNFNKGCMQMIFELVIHQIDVIVITVICFVVVMDSYQLHCLITIIV